MLQTILRLTADRLFPAAANRSAVRTLLESRPSILAVQRYPSHISWNFHDLRYNAVAGMSGMEPG
jgi:hypothetical protein